MNDSFRLALEKHQQGFLDQAAQLYLGLQVALFPRASFIHCRRDLRDIAVSCWMTRARALHACVAHISH
jgi:hypothetical protein